MTAEPPREPAWVSAQLSALPDPLWAGRPSAGEGGGSHASAVTGLRRALRALGVAAGRQRHHARALTSGEIDLHWEYTGTAWITYMDETRPIPDERDQYRAVSRRDLRENGIAWLPYAPFNNTHGLAVRREAAGRLGVRTISDGRVDIEGLTEEEVAESWLAEQGLVPAGAGLEAAGERE